MTEKRICSHPGCEREAYLDICGWCEDLEFERVEEGTK